MLDTTLLLPCPFCGCENLRVGESEYCGDSFSPNVSISCDLCPGGMVLYGDTLEDVIQDITLFWNSRKGEHL